MSAELKAGDWQALTKNERIALCRRLAEEAQKHSSSGSELGRKWDGLASRWRMLAAEIEQSR
jgi:hypothetical protein